MITCRSGRRVGLAHEILEKHGLNGYRYEKLDRVKKSDPPLFGAVLSYIRVLIDRNSN